jgi:predicted tellurium resistance membrane protein TerC
MLAELFTLEHLTTFLILTALETVLGFDNLLYISIEAKRTGEKSEAYVRRMGIFLAIGLRIALLFVVLKLIDLFQEPFIHFDWIYATGAISGHALIVLVGGVFLIYTAMKEIYHLLATHELGQGQKGAPTRTVMSAFIWIILMNIVFSFDTVLSAVALTKNFPVMAAAIIISGILMVVMADIVANFLKRNRMYEVLGLFVLLLVGFMLMSEGGHIAHLAFFGYPIEPMAKSTFYFVLFTLVVVEVVQSRYQRKLLAEEGKTDH